MEATLYSYTAIACTVRGPVTEVRLNRPERRNAFNAVIMAELTDFFTKVGSSSTRLIVMTGEGRDFCSGADLDWMRQAESAAPEQSSEMILAMYEAIAKCRLPIICRVFGRVYAGGIGLCAIADIAVAEASATFCMAEVRVGLAPALMAPFVVDRIGPARFRELTLTGRSFDTAEAYRLGLIDHQFSSEAIEDGVANLIKEVLKGAPGALAASKQISRSLSYARWEAVAPLLGEILTSLRQSPEAKEGIAAFLCKRQPAWQEESTDANP